MCCSGKRTIMRSTGTFRPDANAPRPSIPVVQTGPAFQRVGAGALTVREPVSGKLKRLAPAVQLRRLPPRFSITGAPRNSRG